jgi:hypothetical protein
MMVRIAGHPEVRRAWVAKKCLLWSKPDFRFYAANRWV